MDPRIHPGSDGRFRIWNDRTEKWTVYETEAEAVRALPKGRAPKTDSGPMFDAPRRIADSGPMFADMNAMRERDVARHRERELLEGAFHRALSGRFLTIGDTEFGDTVDATATIVLGPDDARSVELCEIDHVQRRGWSLVKQVGMDALRRLPATTRSVALAVLEDLSHRGTVGKTAGGIAFDGVRHQTLDSVLKAAHERQRNHDELEREKAQRMKRDAEENTQPHIREFTDGFRVWSPTHGRYLQDGLRGAFATREAAQYKLGEVLRDAKPPSSGKAKPSPRAGAAPSLFAEAPRRGEQVGLFGTRQNPRRPTRSLRVPSSRPNPSGGRSRSYYTASAVNARTGVRETVEQVDAVAARRLYGKSVERSLHQRWKELAATSSTTGLVVTTKDGRRYKTSSLTVERVRVGVV